MWWYCHCSALLCTCPFILFHFQHFIFALMGLPRYSLFYNVCEPFFFWILFIRHRLQYLLDFFLFFFVKHSCVCGVWNVEFPCCLCFIQFISIYFLFIYWCFYLAPGSFVILSTSFSFINILFVEDQREKYK